MLCSQCFDRLGYYTIKGISPQSKCAECGRLCMGYEPEETKNETKPGNPDKHA